MEQEHVVLTRKSYDGFKVEIDLLKKENLTTVHSLLTQTFQFIADLASATLVGDEHERTKQNDWISNFCKTVHINHVVKWVNEAGKIRITELKSTLYP